MSPFTPTTGDKSRRAIALGLLADCPEGEVVTYEQLADGLGIAERPIAQAAVNTAKATLEREHSKAVVAVPDVGYRVVHAGEHLDLAKSHQKASRRQLAKARSKLVHVDTAKLTEGEQAAITIACTALGLQIDYMRRADIRTGNLESAVAKLKGAQGKSDQTVAGLVARLDKLEAKFAGKKKEDGAAA